MIFLRLFLFWLAEHVLRPALGRRAGFVLSAWVFFADKDIRSESMTTSGAVQPSAFINCVSPLEFIDKVKEICDVVESTPEPDLGILSVNVLGSSVHVGKLRFCIKICN